MKVLAANSTAYRRPLAFSSSRVGTSAGTMACEALSKNTSAVPNAIATTHSIQISTPSSATSTASAPTTSARVVSAVTMIRLRSDRSINAPIGSDITSHGRAAAAATTEIATSSRVRRAASNGSATKNTPSPRFEMPLASQSLQYAGGRR